MTVAEQFAIWLRENPRTWAAFEAIVAEYRAAGHTQWAVNAAREEQELLDIYLAAIEGPGPLFETAEAA